MSLESIILQRLNAITERLNQIQNNAKRTEEFPIMETLDLLAKIRVSISGSSQQLQLQKLIDFLDTIFLGVDDVFLQRQIIYATHEWVEDYTFRIIFVKWVNNGVVYEQLFDQNVTLEESHATLNRKDIIALNVDTQLIEIVTGTPSSEPSLPSLNANQLMITFVDVDADTTAPPSINNVDVYRENTEWEGTVVQEPVDFEDTNPQTGTYNIKVGGGSGFYFEGLQLMNGCNGLVLNIKLSQEIQAESFWIRVNDNSENLIGYTSISHGIYGFNRGSTDWQTIVIPPADLGLNTGVTVEYLDFSFDEDFPVAYLDNIYFQFGGTPPFTGGDFLPRGGYTGTAMDLYNLISTGGFNPAEHDLDEFLNASGNPYIRNADLSETIRAWATPPDEDVEHTKEYYLFTITENCELLSAINTIVTAPTGATLNTEIRKNGTIVTPDSGNINFAISSTVSGTALYDGATFVSGDIVSLYVSQIGSTIAGQGIITKLIFKKL